MRKLALALAVLVAGVVHAPWSYAQTPQPPTFRSAVEVTTVDATVVDGSGRQITDLRAEDFSVRVDGRPRPVVRIEWVPLVRPSTTPAPPPPPDGYSTNEGSTGGRLIIIAIDQPNIRPDGGLAIRSTVDAFLDRLEPSDRVVAVALGNGVSTPFTTNRSTVKEALARMSGEMRPITSIGTYSLTASEALDIAEGGQASLQSVVSRECTGAAGRVDAGCRTQVVSDAQAIALSLHQSTDRTVNSLRGLLEGLKGFEAPKTLVLVSEGFGIHSPGSLSLVSSLAAAARTTIHALKLDDRVFDASSRRPAPQGVGDRQLRYAGLSTLTAESKGDVFDVVGTGGAAIQRLEQEISGYYLIGVESVPADRDGKAHPISLRVSRGGAVVRARRDLADVSLARGDAAGAPLEAVAAALGSPLVATTLPLHVATFSLRDEDPSRIQVLIHADIGSDYTTAKAVSLGYVISDSRGTVVVHQVGGGRLAPFGSGPAPLAYTVSASLAPGEYTLKLAVAEGGLTGSVEHPVHAGLIEAGPLKLSELMIGGPADAKELLRPTIGYDIAFGGVQGYVEAYGAAEETLLVRYEVAPAIDAPSLVSAVVPGRVAGDGRVVFSYLMPVDELPPGPYYLRATLSSRAATGAPLKRIARAFRVRPAPATATANGGAAAPAAIPDATLTAAPPANATSVRSFRREAVLEGDTLDRFRDLVTPAARQDFDAGVAALGTGDFSRAEASFKNAQRAGGAAGGNSTAPLAYLAATYAASGHHLEAANVWQTALIDGNAYPQIYEWLADALVRLRSFDQARSILEEASDRWPGDERFSSRLAELRSTPRR